MTARIALAGLALAIIGLPATGQFIPQSETANLSVTYKDVAGGKDVKVLLTGASGPAFFMAATLDDPDGDPIWELSGLYVMEENGVGHVEAFVPDAIIPEDNPTIYTRAMFLEGKKLRVSNSAGLKLGDFPCSSLDWDWGSGAIPLSKGEIVTDQWAPAGINISCTNLGGGPDLAIIFDSADPSGDDDDLATPHAGCHPSNTVPLGNLLIIAEDDGGAGDGFVDEPDDESGGGIIHIDFDKDVAICGATVIDIEELGGEMKFWRGDDLITTVPVPAEGDCSVKDVEFFVEGVTRFELCLVGSGALGGVQLQPCPTYIQWDERPLGQPLDLPAGTIFTDQLAGEIGMVVSADNFKAGHPDIAILFDSANPTGGDNDLRTPGGGIGNDTAEGMLLIIAEDDVDEVCNGVVEGCVEGVADGLIDDPDDEAKGGEIYFDFDCEVRFQEARVIDIDESEVSWIDLYGIGEAEGFFVLLDTIPLASLGDNSAQTVFGDQDGVRRIVLHLGGSGGIACMRVCPDCDDEPDDPNGID